MLKKNCKRFTTSYGHVSKDKPSSFEVSTVETEFVENIKLGGVINARVLKNDMYFFSSLQNSRHLMKFHIFLASNKRTDLNQLQT